MQQSLPPDVVRLVLAAREIAFGGYMPMDATARIELDAASEAFADRVPWDDEPEDRTVIAAAAKHSKETL